MNMLKRFILTTLCLLFTLQAFASVPKITKIERVGKKLAIATFDQPVKLDSVFAFTLISVRLYSGDTYYMGSAEKSASLNTVYINQVNGYARQMQIRFADTNPAFTSLDAADASGKTSLTIRLSVRIKNAAGESNVVDKKATEHIGNLFLCWENCIPMIEQFTVTQGGNTDKGRLITKNSGIVTIRAVANARTYQWDGSDFSAIDGNDKATFSFDPSTANLGTHTIQLTTMFDGHSITRVLALKLVDDYPDHWTDANNNGIPDSKETDYQNNQLLAGIDKKITSPAGTRILLGAMGTDSGYLTPEQMKQYRANNQLSDNTSDTQTTGDIYDYVIEGLNATGDSTQVIIQLTTAIPAEAELRQYSPTHGWQKFVINDNNIQSKTSTTCTDDSPWQTGLTTGATCLKLTIKDGGENDTDNNQANGVITSTISIATPTVVNDDNDGGSDDSSGSSGSSGGGGGCTYNPNAPARFDIGFILLIALSTYYLIRRKRRFTH